ncbi:response regulator [Rhizobacter sp. Root1221]|uniref:response regulator n=1 Tax=Rhizobacter sp. Root1221 TaxID=1736433 RepID=UPI0006FA5B54|nr:response regulator [Rhizobacter sp. Root1221]KQV99619.1 hypothetical protein ASC87_02645 [Rhizobacter sp. Root1221]
MAIADRMDVHRASHRLPVTILAPRVPKPVVRLPLAAGSERILVIDPRAELAAITARMLSDLGYVAYWGVNDFDVLDLLASGDPIDLLVCPLALPSIPDGLAVIQKAVSRQPGLRVLLTSGSVPSHAERAAAGAYPLLAKPYGQAKLGNWVRQALDTAATAARQLPEAVTS